MQYTFSGGVIGPLTINLELDDQENRLVGEDAERLTRHLVETLRALHALRTIGRPTKEEAVYTLETLRTLAAKVDGVTAAIIRRWDGTLGELADAMGAPRSTAQSRREAIRGEPPSDYERWATEVPRSW